MYSLAIFDMDGTLLDTIGDLQNAGNYALKQLGFPVHSREAYIQFIGKGLHNQMMMSLPEGHRDQATISKMEPLYHSFYQSNLSVHTMAYPGIYHMLQQLKLGGTKLAILTNKPHRYAVKLAGSFFPGTFDSVMGKLNGFPPKPDPASLLWLVREMGFSGSDCIYVGDSDVDAQTAQAAGIDMAALSWGYCTADLLREAGATNIFDKADDLLQFIIDKDHRFVYTT